jgi:hypothetical protein
MKAAKFKERNNIFSSQKIPKNPEKSPKNPEKILSQPIPSRNHGFWIRPVRIPTDVKMSIPQGSTLS